MIEDYLDLQYDKQFTENTYFGKNMDTGTTQIATLNRIILNRLLRNRATPPRSISIYVKQGS